MQLCIIVEDRQKVVQLDPSLIDKASQILEKMDRDMDSGWQFGRRYLEYPGVMERCQIAADRILTAMHNDNEATVSLMAAYILTRLPEAAAVSIDTAGEPENTVFYDRSDRVMQ